jgi:hypothetical protein
MRSRRPVIALVVLAVSALAGGWASAGAAAPACPATTDAAGLESTTQLLADNQVMSDLGRRPTGSPAQNQFINWLQNRLSALPGMQISSVSYPIKRWDDQGQSLAAGPTPTSLAPVALSGPVPYAHATRPGGVTAPLLYVPAGTALAGQDIAGKIVIRDAVPGQVPFAAFSAVEWFHYDPDLSLTKNAATGGVYERDFAGYQQRLDDLTAAGHGAAGLVFVHGFPRSQVAGQYAPYEGLRWNVPAVYVGADEGARLKALAAAHGAARLQLSTATTPVRTRMLTATLPGVSPERMVIQSHTDGMNAIWDNGPVAMLALARRFAALPASCRPRTLQFVFTTGHLYQHLKGGADRGGSSELEARQIDAAYGSGTVAMVFAIEHLGAREYAAVARTDGGPGRQLKQTGQTEINTMFAGQSPVLVNAIRQAVMDHGITRTYVLRGSDAPGARIPIHDSFGGEGTSYQQHLIPSIALVSGPWSLYNPSFGMEAVDGDLMRRQTLAFSDMIGALASEPSNALGGSYLVERQARNVLCSNAALADTGFTRCPGSPYG